MNVNARIGLPLFIENLERFAKQENNEARPVIASRFETLALLMRHIENDEMWNVIMDAGVRP